LKMRWNKRWTFSGIKRFYPNLSYEDWLKICSKKNHEYKSHDSVIACLGRESNEINESAESA